MVTHTRTREAKRQAVLEERQVDAGGQVLAAVGLADRDQELPRVDCPHVPAGTDRQTRNRRSESDGGFIVGVSSTVAATDNGRHTDEYSLRRLGAHRAATATATPLGRLR